MISMIVFVCLLLLYYLYKLRDLQTSSFVSKVSGSTFKAIEASVSKYRSSSDGKTQTLSIHRSKLSLELYPWKKARSLKSIKNSDVIRLLQVISSFPKFIIFLETYCFSVKFGWVELEFYEILLRIYLH